MWKREREWSKRGEDVSAAGASATAKARATKRSEEKRVVTNLCASREREASYVDALIKTTARWNPNPMTVSEPRRAMGQVE